MSLKLNSSGGGSVTVQEPTTASNVTLNLPAADGTVVFENSSGNVGIGTSSPGAKLDVRGSSTFLVNATNPTAWVSVDSALTTGSMYNQWNTTSNVGISGTYTNHAYTFVTNNTERARIDTSGNLLVGGTASVASSRLLVKGSGTTSATTNLYIQNSAATDILYIRDDGAVNTGTTTSSPYNLTTGTAANANLGADGFLRRSTSSLKYKRDVQDATHGLSDVLQLRPVTYKGKSEADGETVFGGLIAEEVHDAGLTEFVQYAEDGSPDALAYGNMVSLCIKAIQEQQQMIETLQAKVAALEGASA